MGEGRLLLTFTGPDGADHRVTADAPSRPGIFGPTVRLPAGGNYDLVIEYEGTDFRDEIWVGPVHVYGSAAELPAQEKNRLSHRGQALRALVSALRGGASV